jgi:thiol-disulfide isomerase/thioredoxin
LTVALLVAAAASNAAAETVAEARGWLVGEWIGNVGTDQRLRRMEIRELRELSDGRWLAAGAWGYLDGKLAPVTIAGERRDGRLELSLVTALKSRVTLSPRADQALAGSFVLKSGREGAAELYKTMSYVSDLPQADAAGPVAVSQRFADFRFADAEGTARRLSDLRGRPVLAVRWETWCPACMREMLDLAALRRRYGEEELAIVLLSASARIGQSYLDNNGLALRGHEIKGGFPKGLVIGVPFHALIDRDGTLIATRQGRQRGDQLVELLGLPPR